MNIFKNAKLGLKVSLIMILVVAILVGGVFTYLINDTRDKDIEAAQNNADAIARENAAMIKAELETALDAARTTSQLFSAYENLPEEDRRMILNSMLEELLNQNPSFLGVWAVYEPNQLDDMDELFADQEGYDNTGRFIPYWYRSNNEIKTEPLVGYETPGDGDYYLRAYESGKEVILDPYTYQVDGKDVLLTTFAAPIFNSNNEVVGATGVDISLDYLNDLAFSKGTYKSTYSFTLANNGVFVTHPKETMIGSNILDLDDEFKEQVVNSIENKQEYSFEDRGLSTGFGSWKSIIPINIGDTDTSWGAGVVIEMDEILQASQSMMILLIFILLGLLVLIAFAIIKILKKLVTNPITNLVNVADKIALGDIDVEVKADSKDEIGQLANSFGDMIDNTKEQAKAAENIAAGNLDIEINEKSDKD
ncbi:MAG: cache domain-containing protein, partial [Clostridia bacterium]